VDALSDAQRRALAERLAHAGDTRGRERLVGFVVPHSTSTPADEALRVFLAERVPDYMIPARFVSLERLPRTAAGKLDRQALSGLVGTEMSSQTPAPKVTAPRTEIEAKLVAIWKDVLKVDDVGVDDDFFEIGGDSLLSIRVIARAGREGIRIAPDRFFERPTIAHLAASVDGYGARRMAARSGGRVADPVGEAPLTPIQRWFLDTIPHHRDRWNQSYLLEVGNALTAGQLRAVVSELVSHHDALRLRLVCRDEVWLQEFRPPDADPPLRVVDLRSTPRAAQAARVAEECEREHASLRLDDGNLFRCIFFEMGAGSNRVFLLGHHVVLDNVSWGVILEDLATLVIQTVAGMPLRLPEKTASARAWAVALADRAGSTTVAESVAHWTAMPAETIGGIAGYNRDAELLAVTLGVEESQLLLHEAPKRLDATAQALLLGGLLLAWREWTGRHALRVDLEGHGRDVLSVAMDVSRTVGWFTTVFPIYLSLPRGVDDGDAPPVESVVKAVGEALDALPMRGAAHGLARYLAPDESVRAALAAQPRPVVLFNYVGTHDVTLPAASQLRVLAEPQGRARDLDAPRPYSLEINARVEHGTLIITIEYARQAYTAAAMQDFGSSLCAALSRIACGASVPVGLRGVDPSSLAIVADLLAELDEA
jgi:non-ribosomal peptide synthase protein (TIGR01720 family)